MKAYSDFINAIDSANVLGKARYMLKRTKKACPSADEIYGADHSADRVINRLDRAKLLLKRADGLYL